MPRIKKTETSAKYTFAVGRRKEAIARIRLFSGRGQTMVNNKPIEEYFPGEANKALCFAPLKEIDALGKYFVTARILGGGPSGQLDAFVHGLSRALAKVNREKFRKPLKERGFLTRDARTRERRKVGTGGKARRKKQSPKR